MQADCYTVSRETMKISNHFTSHTWELNRDYITNERSTFSISDRKNLAIVSGDFFVAKFMEHKNIVQTYIGIVDGLDEDQVTVCDIQNILNFSVVSVRLSGNNVLEHLRATVDKYVFSASDKGIKNINIDIGSDTISYTYQPEDPPNSMYLVDYFVDNFKKYGVLWEAQSLTRVDGAYEINTILQRPPAYGVIKDNIYDIINWNIMVTPSGVAAENKINILDKKTISLDNPMILDTWYVTKNSEIVNTFNPETVTVPTKDKIYIYDDESEDKPTYEEVARAELEASKYSHEITFDIAISGTVAGWDWLYMGNQVVVMYKGTRYDSIITGYTLDSERPLLTVRMGFIRSNLKQVIMELKDQS